MLSLGLLSDWSFIGMGFNLSKEWLCCDVDRWRKVRKRRRESKPVKEIEEDLWETLPPNRTLRIGIQLQMIPAQNSAVLQNLTSWSTESQDALELTSKWWFWLATTSNRLFGSTWYGRRVWLKSKQQRYFRWFSAVNRGCGMKITTHRSPIKKIELTWNFFWVGSWSRNIDRIGSTSR